jgi:hypothetical protein
MSDERNREVHSQETPIQSGWELPLQVYYCAHCHRAHLSAVDVTLAVCPACLHPEVAAQPEHMRREPPELVIPFAVDGGRLSSVLQEWSRARWFRPDDLSFDILANRTRPYYLPLWLIDGHVQATWQAEMGYDYQAASFREKYAGSQWVSQEVTETRTRWEPRAGRLDRRYDNLVVPALSDHSLQMSRLGGYDFRSRKAYSPRAIAGSVVRVPDQSPEAAWPDAESAFTRAAELECQAAAEADHVRGWSMRAQYQDRNWTQMLVPAFVTYYREGEHTYPVWVNGQNGRIYGVKVVSQRKANLASFIIGGIAAILFLIAALLSLIGAILVAPVVIGVIVGVLGLLLGLCAPIPAIWAWLRNRKANPE